MSKVTNPKPPLWFAQLFEQMQTAIVCSRLNLDIIYSNTAAEQLLLTSKSQLHEASLALFFDSSVDIKSLSKRAVFDQQKFTLLNTDLVLKNKLTVAHVFSEQAIKKVDISLSAIPQASQIRSPNSTSDVSTEESLVLLFEIHHENEQADSVKLDNTGEQQKVTREIVRKVAHEIKNPLASMRGAAQLIQMTSEQPSLPIPIKTELTEYTDIIIKESDRLKKVTDAMLGSNKLLNKSIHNIHEPIEHVIALIKNQFPDITLIRDYDASLPEISFDHDRIIQVFLNIALNAAQVLTENKVNAANIRFKTRIAFNTDLHNQVHRQAVSVSIIDNGIGIPKALQKTLFYPMVSARHEGTGLGLSIAQDMMRHHKGEITVNSQSGETHFIVLFPTYLEKTHI